MIAMASTTFKGIQTLVNKGAEIAVNKCDETAGIFLGRTTIEGFLCNKPAWIYTVDKEGNFLNKEYTEVPKDMTIFDNNKIIEKYKEVYVSTYNQI